MDDGLIPLASDFPAVDRAEWLRLVDKTLDGQSFEKRLVSSTYEGVKIEPLYVSDPKAPPAMDAVRPAAAADPDRPWDLRVLVDHPDPGTANTFALAELEGGAASLLISIDPSGEDGVAVSAKEDLEQVLHGVHLDLAPVTLEAGFLGAKAAGWLGEIAEARTLKPHLFLHMDPISAFARSGASPGPVDAQIAVAAEAAKRISATGAFIASGQVVHEAGGGEAQELGFMAAAAIAYARAAIAIDVEPRDAFSGIILGLACDAEYFNTLAKLRAARVIWARVTSAALGELLPARIEARSSRRMLSALDPWVNMLRLTAASFGAGAGGADAVVLDAFSRPLGRATSFARRQSRNTQLVLMEEARLGAVADPGGGAWFVEALTDQFARAGWAYMQAIEAAGGIVSALESGKIARDVETICDARVADIAKRKAGLIGVSEFPDLSSRSVEVDPAAAHTFAKPSPDIALPGPDSRCTPLAPWRAAGAFETLRARASALSTAPFVFLATLGTPADHSGRSGFARNLFAAGGIAAETGAPTDYDANQTPLAVICSSDAVYGDQAVAAARTLRERGARWVYLAGRPGLLEGDLRTAGVEHFLYAGMDVTKALDDALALLESRSVNGAPVKGPGGGA